MLLLFIHFKELVYEDIKACLMNRHDHPTADAIYASIREEFPSISLGTVYRNLNLLVELGEARKLTFGDGKDHFDGDTAPHYHFVCRCCGGIQDLPPLWDTDLEDKMQPHIRGKIDSHSIDFYGICSDCMIQHGH